MKDYIRCKKVKLPFAAWREGKGFTFIEVLVGTFLILLIFSSIFGLIQLSVAVIGQNKNKISATSIAVGAIEKIKNLPYAQVGIKDGFPEGILDFSTTTVQNNVQYTIETRVDYAVDDIDGIALPQDDCPNDYKKVEVKVLWSGRLGGEVLQVTNIAPKNLAQECAEGGGVLSVSVFDAFGAMIPFPLIEIKDPLTDENIKTASPLDGKHYFSLATSTYKVVVSKPGYNSDRTFSIAEIATPENPNPNVLEGQLAEISFSIDKVSSFSVDTLSPWGSDSFFDSFSDESKISEKSNLVLADGEVSLATNTQGYLTSGYLISQEVAPSDLISWDKLYFSDAEPFGTDLRYQIYFASGTIWYLVPDSDLPQNSTGNSVSPLDLSGVPSGSYSSLEIKASFSTLSTSTTPVLLEWQMSWINSSSSVIAGALFELRGNKIVGTDANELPVYKYSISTSTDIAGHKNILDLEWDSYTFSIDSGTGLDLVSTDPVSQPINLSPDENIPVKLYLDAQNSFLITLQDFGTLEPIFAGTVRLYNLGLGYDETLYTNVSGQTYFIPLQSAVYNLDLSAPGRLATSTTVSISGDKTKIISLDPEE